MSQQQKNTYFECPRVIHENVACLACKRKSIAGIRYRCGHCPNLDLCEPCYRSVKHDETHLFVIIRDPISYLPSQPLISIIPKLVKPNNTLMTTTTTTISPPKNPLTSSFNPDQFSMQLTKEEQSNNRRFAPLNDSFHSYNDSNRKADSPPSIFSQLSQTADQQNSLPLNVPMTPSFGSFFESKKPNISSSSSSSQSSNTSNSGGFGGFGSISSNNNNKFNPHYSFDNTTTMVRHETTIANQTSYFEASPFASQSNSFAFGTTSTPSFANNTQFSLTNTEEGMETDTRENKPFSF